jgi:hypothetical protein
MFCICYGSVMETFLSSHSLQVYMECLTWRNELQLIGVKTKTKLRGLSLRANCTDRTNRRSSAKLVPTFAVEDATSSAWLIPTAVFSVF